MTSAETFETKATDVVDEPSDSAGGGRRRLRKGLVFLIAIGASTVLCCAGVVTPLLFSASQLPGQLGPCGFSNPAFLAGQGPPSGSPEPSSSSPPPSPSASQSSASASSSPSPRQSGPLPKKIGPWKGEQVTNAAIVVQVGEKMKVPPRGWVIALATAMQESLLRNLQRGDRDSLGLFQQRPSQGWGTAEQILDPRYSAGKFFEKLQRIPNWESMRLSDAAQAVQVSGVPGAYQKWEDEANFLVAAVAGRDIGDLLGPQICVTVGQISGQGWTVPAPGHVGSGFRPPDRPKHNGVDIISPRRTAIVAAADGVVVTAICNASTGNCDTDGSPSVLGCGWYVEIDNGGGISTRYCHMQQRPMVAEGQQVRAGQQLGIVGSSGNSSGPHLHFETHINGEPVDPVPFMQQRGAPLGQSEAAQAKAN